MGIEHYENFPVASLLCPSALRPAVRAIYHYARTADDLADEGDCPEEQRLADLAAYRSDLLAIFAGAAPSARWPFVFGELAVCRQTYHLPMQDLADLLSAFEQDVRNPVYETRDTLLAYCARSANPIGRLLLHLYGVNDAASLRQSDAICTALQLTNFWQDLSVDLPRRRCYLPAADLMRHGLRPQDALDTEHRAAMRLVVRELCDWTTERMRVGLPLATQLPGRVGWELRLVTQGCLRVLQKIEHQGFDTLTRRPVISAFDAPGLLWRCLRMGSAIARAHA